MIRLKHVSWSWGSNYKATHCTTVALLMTLPLLDVPGGVCVLLDGESRLAVVGMFDGFDEAFGQSFQALSLVLEHLLILLVLHTVERLTVGRASVAVTIGSPLNDLVLYAAWPLTWLSLKEVVLTNDTVAIAKRRSLRCSHVAPPRIISSLTMLASTSTSIVIHTASILVTTVISRVQRLALFK